MDEPILQPGVGGGVDTTGLCQALAQRREVPWHNIADSQIVDELGYVGEFVREAKEELRRRIQMQPAGSMVRGQEFGIEVVERIRGTIVDREALEQVAKEHGFWERVVHVAMMRVVKEARADLALVGVLRGIVEFRLNKEWRWVEEIK